MFTNFTRAVTALGLAAAVWAPAQVSAQEQRVVGKPVPIEAMLSFEAPMVCPFDVGIEVQGLASTLELPNGTVIYLGPQQTATVTNLETGESLDLKISGPIKQRGSQFVFVGPTLVIRSVAFGDVEEGLLYVNGRTTFDPTADPVFTTTGTSTDICAALA